MIKDLKATNMDNLYYGSEPDPYTVYINPHQTVTPGIHISPGITVIETNEVPPFYVQPTSPMDDVDPDPTKVEFEGGAGRSKRMPWYTFVPRYFIKRLAAVFEYGAKKYGLKNWQKGNQEFIDEIPDHIIGHVYDYIEENNGTKEPSGEDHLANITANVVMLMHFQKEGKFPRRMQG